MWQTLLRHEFQDDDVQNFQGMRGGLTSTGTMRRPPGRAASLFFTPGQGLSFLLDEPSTKVVGFSAVLAVHYPDGPIGQHVVILRLGPTIDVSLSRIPGAATRLDGVMGFRFSILCGFDGSQIDVGSVFLPYRSTVTLKFVWHTSGQFKTYVDGSLACYHPGVAVGRQVDVQRCDIGLEGLDPALRSPRFTLSLASIRVLPSLRSFDRLTGMIPPVREGEPHELDRCEVLVRGRMEELLGVARSLMADFHSTTSTAWSSGDGNADAPFAAEAVEVHDRCRDAAIALARMLRSNDYSQPEEFLEPFLDALKTIHSVVPGPAAAAWTAMQGVPGLPGGCVVHDDATPAAGSDAEAFLGPLVKASAQIEKFMV